MGHALTLIGMGFSFALIGLGNIGVALARHVPIFEPLQWYCLIFFTVFVLAGVARVVLHIITVTKQHAGC